MRESLLEIDAERARRRLLSMAERGLSLAGARIPSSFHFSTPQARRMKFLGRKTLRNRVESRSRNSCVPRDPSSTLLRSRPRNGKGRSSTATQLVDHSYGFTIIRGFARYRKWTLLKQLLLTQRDSLSKHTCRETTKCIL